MSSLPVGRHPLDPSRSSVEFAKRMLGGLFTGRGRLPAVDGELRVGEGEPGIGGGPLGRLWVRLDVARLSTRPSFRGDAVRSARYLDAERYPSIEFEGELKQGEAGRGTIAGELTVRGIARPAVVDVTVEDRDGSASLRLRGGTTVDRYDYGVTRGGRLLGRTLRVGVDVTFTVAAPIPKRRTEP